MVKLHALEQQDVITCQGHWAQDEHGSSFSMNEHSGGKISIDD